jgi:RecB family exonuclease
MPVYSHSKLSTYENCPQQYKLRYIDRMQPPEGEESIEIFLGNRAHETLQKLHKELILTKLNTLDELLNYYKNQWDKNWHDNVVIIKKEFTKDHYYNTGLQAITSYYKRYYPFNQSKTLSTEQLIVFKIEDYTIQGFIDRLSHNGKGVYEIHDYKTSAYLPTQNKLDSDRQLALYQIGIKDNYRDAKDVILKWYYLVYDKEFTSIRSDSQLKDLKKEVISLIKTIEKDKSFKPYESGYCDWCELEIYCPAKKHELKVQDLPLNKYLKEEGVTFVNKYASIKSKIKDLKEQEEELQMELDLIEEAAIEYARNEEITTITGSEFNLRISEDIVKHFLNRGYQGKAMVVSIDKPTAVKMYDKVQKYWSSTINDLKKQLKNAKENKDEIQKQIDYMKDTDMAVVVSQEQNEIEKFKKLGLKIGKHRRRMVKEDLATKFKDPNNFFRIVFVCAMWMTGFDVPCLSTMYLDKPMKNHTLMQTIARANRVFRDKMNGLLVDYCGIFRNLQKALAIYGADKDGATDSPVKPKAELIRELEDAILEIEKVCDENNADIRKIAYSDKLMQIKYIGDATDALLVKDDTKRQYLALASQVDKLFKAILPDPDAKKYADICTVVRVIAERIRSIIEVDVDIADIKRKIEDLLNETIEVVGYIKEDKAPYGERMIDLSKIDFEALKKKFDKGKKRNTQVAMLEAVIRGKLERLVRLNKMRAELLERFQKMIAEYNAGSINIEKLFEELLEFVKRLDEEEQRSIKENLSEEELSLFDILKKPKLTNKEIEQIKLASKKLLRVLKSEKLILDWRKKQQARAEVLFTIETILDEMLPKSYTPEIYRQKCDFTYQHVYDSYYGDGKSVYILMRADSK